MKLVSGVEGAFDLVGIHIEFDHMMLHSPLVGDSIVDDHLTIRPVPHINVDLFACPVVTHRYENVTRAWSPVAMEPNTDGLGPPMRA